MASLRAGTFEIAINGTIYDAVGNFTFNLGAPKREALVGPDRVHGYKEDPQAPMLSGEIRDGSVLNVTNELLLVTDATITIKMGSGKIYMLENAFYTGDGNIETEEGKVQVEFYGESATEI